MCDAIEASGLVILLLSSPFIAYGFWKFGEPNFFDDSGRIARLYLGAAAIYVAALVMLASVAWAC